MEEEEGHLGRTLKGGGVISYLISNLSQTALPILPQYSRATPSNQLHLVHL
jgi:hypothetical protein